MHILIIEDDPDLTRTLAEQLQPTYVVDSSLTGKQGVLMASRSHYDLITVDVGLPDMSGLDVCRELRRKKIECPILVLTGIDQTDTKVEALDVGADDFLVKPFHLMELLARIRALLRRHPSLTSQPILAVSDLEVDPNTRTVRRDGNVILLRRREYDILELLMRHKGHIVSRDIILEHVSPYDSYSHTNTIDVHVKRLRDKIDRPFANKLIRTAHGLGYGIISEGDV